jgi:hypothetical protein
MMKIEERLIRHCVHPNPGKGIIRPLTPPENDKRRE